MNSKSLLMFVILVLSLTACAGESISADRLPWVNEHPVLFKDDFAEHTGGWNTHENSLSFTGYDQGGFRLWSDVPGYQFWSVPGLNLRDAHIFVRVRKIDGPDDNLFGLLCRYQNDANFYALVIGSDGYYGIFKRVAGEQRLVDQAHLQFSEIINRGGADNEIQALCLGDQLSLIVNGIQLIHVQDDALRFGDVGMIVSNFSEPGVDILFDDFIVIKP